MAAQAVQRKHWSLQEIGALVSIVGHSPYLRIFMGSTTTPNTGAWRQVGRALARQDYRRSVEQMRAKWKTIKAAFHTERTYRLRHRRPSRHSPVFYRELRQLWKQAGRPTFRDRRYTVAMADVGSHLAAAALPPPPSQRRAPPLPPSSSEGSEAEVESGTSPSPSEAEAPSLSQEEQEPSIQVVEEEEEHLGPSAWATSPPPQEVEEMVEEERATEATAAVPVEEERAAEATAAVPTPVQRRRQRRWEQRRRRMQWAHAQYNFSALGHRLLSQMRGLRHNVQVVIGRHMGMQDQLLYLEGHCRVEFRTLRDIHRLVCHLLQRPTAVRANLLLARLDQLLALVGNTQTGVMAIMARLGIAPDHPEA